MEKEHCRRKIAAVEDLIHCGHAGLDGLCLADSWAELRLIEAEMALEAKTPATAEAGRAEGTEQNAIS